MTLKDIYEILDTLAPFKYEEEWDNSGVILGDLNAPVGRILVTLDVTDEVVECAIEGGYDLIISHHPLIFKPVKQINSENFITNRIVKLAFNRINYIAMHTNIDSTVLSEVADEMLRIKRESPIEINEMYPEDNVGIGSIGKFMNEKGEVVDITLREAVIRTKNAFGRDVVKVYGNIEDIIKKPAVCTGSGKSVIETCISKNCDLLITGDITYHDALDARARGLSIIDAGHYGTEIIFTQLLSAFIKMNIPDVEVVDFIEEENGLFM